MIPEIMKNFNLFIDGRGFAGKVLEVTPPKLTIKTEEFQAGGMDVPVDIDMGMEKLSCDFTLAEYNSDVLKLWGVSDGNAVKLTLRGAIQDDAGQVKPVTITLQGLFKELDLGTWKPGEKTEKKCTASCRYYKLAMDGETIYEIDAVNMVRIVGGQDQMAEIRSAIGV